MSDSQEKSDDLIAELARLMASGAGAEAGPKPAVIKLPPLNDATIQATPVRIPGMEPPRGTSVAEAPRPAPQEAASTPPKPAAPPVRIPGMDRPASAEALPSAPAPRPGSQFDFGRPPSAAPVIKSQPLSDWQSSEVPRTLPTTPPPAASTSAAAPLVKFEPVKFPAGEEIKPATARVEPKPAAPVAPTPVQPASVAPTHPVSHDDGDKFDSESFAPDTHADEHGSESDDPIADLIAAELDSGDEPPQSSTAAQPAEEADEDHEEQHPAPTPAGVPVAPAFQRPAAVQVKPVSVAPRADDRFSVAPVFAQSKPAERPAPQPQAKHAEVDPIDEIESLIGEAVRVELSGQDKAEKREAPGRQAPVVPPLNTGFAPRRAGLKDNEPSVRSAEEAILAAASASGADLDGVDTPPADDRPYKRIKVKPPRTSGIPSGARQYVGIAVAGTLLLASGFGLYWVLGMNRDDPATAPVLTADATPAKVEPTPQPEPETADSGSVVFDEINGETEVASAETLVSRDETAGATVAEVARAVTPVVEDDAGDTGLANRKVRTVTVRPDGTIVSGDEAVAGASELPVDRPNVPDLPGEEPEPNDLLTAAVAGANDAAGATTADPTGSDALSALVAETAESVSAEPVDQTATVDVASLTPAAEETPAVFDASLVSPTPMPRPADRGAMVGGSSQPTATLQATRVNEPASTPLVAVTQQAPAVSSGGSGAYVQLSSQPNEAAAQRSLRSLESRMAGTLNGASLEIRQVDIPGRGTWYRVALPVRSFQDATQTCAAIKANGGDCVAING